ncbi:SDR family NAD(P)-dependent oxidoreductase [Thermocoleostomius sinensis]|uniref:SDR family NAD(P)-dependent oxidoreductase n=1 Tax=Thermocoleostomius sinensis A174 TaxID=2016057 RepID=A0A9E8ZAM4_9CYAN|nr:SDR family NAD(P)-dependent oxidoreductase [Thermocoleostomius sinensis]WAL59665.1 SDR family NAD(P)-dependent oxidoreductase [Thermocoleostomius sinensis A174]
MAAIADLEQTNFRSAFIVGANRGIGLAFVKHLLQTDRSLQLYATYRQADTAIELLALSNDADDRLICLPMDVTDEAQIQQGIEQIFTICPQLHLVINCVGILHEGTLQPEKSLRQITADHLLRYFQVNSIATALLAKHLLPLLQHGDRSVFASISAKLGSIEDNQLGGWYGYRASKAALNMLIRTIAIEYQRRSPNTIVVALHPGTTDTRLSKPFQKNVPPEKLFSTDRTVTQLLNVIANLNSSDSGGFFSWNGSRLPW